MPGIRPEIVVLVPVPVVVMLPGLLVKVQVPVAGRPVNITLPVETVYAGCVTVPIAGAAGVGGWTFITAFTDTADVHPEAFVTVNV